MEAFKTQYSIHLTTVSTVNRNTAKAALTQMVNVVFAKMDTYMRYGSHESIDIRKLHGGKAPSTNSASARASQISSLKTKSEALDEGLKTKSSKEVETEAQDESSSSANAGQRLSLNSGNAPAPLEVNFAALDQYVCSLTTVLVDNVCLHDARVRAIVAQRDAGEREAELGYDQKSEQDKHSESGYSKGAVSQISLEEKIANVKLNPIPAGKKEYPDVNLTNELGIQAGRFGWCIVCRNTANLYCKDTKHPVCSKECQKKHYVEVTSLDGPPGENLPNYTKSDEAQSTLNDAILVFKSIVKLSVEGEN